MQIPEYVSKQEVKRICNELGFRDWSQLKEPVVTEEEASTILGIVNKDGMNISLNDFKQGLEVELEHGTMYESANVTNNHPILTGMIVIAHLKETLDYYERFYYPALQSSPPPVEKEDAMDETQLEIVDVAVVLIRVGQAGQTEEKGEVSHRTA